MDQGERAAGGTWPVHRQDDNGNHFVVRVGLGRDEVASLAAELERRGHKQLYWVEPGPASGRESGRPHHQSSHSSESPMTSPVVSCSGSQGIVGAVNRVGESLPVDVRKRLSRVLVAYMGKYGLEGAYKRLNNRSVEAILTDYHPEDDPTPLVEGERDGVRFRLYESPDAGGEDEQP